MSRDEILYDRALTHQKVLEQRRILAKACNERKYELATIEAKTFALLKTRLKRIDDQIKEFFPNAKVA